MCILDYIEQFFTLDIKFDIEFDIDDYLTNDNIENDNIENDDVKNEDVKNDDVKNDVVKNDDVKNEEQQEPQLKDAFELFNLKPDYNKIENLEKAETGISLNEDNILITNIFKDNFEFLPHPHQVNQIKFMLEHKTGFFNDCCGSGKTFIELCYIAIRHDKRPENKFYTGEKICVVVPRIQLLKQMITKCKSKYKFKYTCYYTEQKEISDITFCVSNSFKEHELKQHFDTLILDEAHHDYTGIFKNNTPSKLKTFYFSATLNIPRIIDLKETENLIEYSHFEAVNEKIVTPFKVWYYVIKHKDNQDEIINSINYLLNTKSNKLGLFNKILIMCNSVIDTQAGKYGVNTVYNKLNHNTVYKITAETKNSQEILKQFEENEKQSVIVNCNCISEGTDLKCVDTVIFKDDRFSEVGLIQSAGRVVRNFKNKKFGNLIFFVEDSQEYIDNFRKEILATLCDYDQATILNSEILNINEDDKQQFNFVDKLFDCDDELRDMINDKSTCLKYRINAICDYIKNMYYPNSKTLPYITKDTNVDLSETIKTSLGMFKITNSLYDIIQPFRKKRFADTIIKNALKNRYEKDVTDSKIVKALITQFMNHIHNEKEEIISNFTKGTEKFIYNNQLYENKSFNHKYYILNCDKEIVKMLLNQRENLKEGIVYYLNINNRFYKFENK